MNKDVEDKHGDEHVTIHLHIDIVRTEGFDPLARIDESHGGNHRVPDTEDNENDNRDDRILIQSGQIGNRRLARERVKRSERGSLTNDRLTTQRKVTDVRRRVQVICRRFWGKLQASARYSPLSLVWVLLGRDGEDAERADGDQENQTESIPIVIARSTS